MAFIGKGVAFYRQQDRGWSDVYWLQAGSFAAGISDLQLINTAYLTLCPSLISCEGLVVYDVGDPRTRASASAEPTTGAGTYTMVTPASVTPDLGVMYRFSGASDRFANRKVRGVPNTVITSEGDYNSVAGWETLFAAFGTVVVPKVNLRHVAPGPPPVVTYEAVVLFQLLGRVGRRPTGRPFGLPRGRRAVG